MRLRRNRPSPPDKALSEHEWTDVMLPDGCKIIIYSDGVVTAHGHGITDSWVPFDGRCDRKAPK